MRRGPEMCTFGLSGCRVKPGGFGASGVHTTARELQTVPVFKNTTKIPREDTPNDSGHSNH